MRKIEEVVLLAALALAAASCDEYGSPSPLVDAAVVDRGADSGLDTAPADSGAPDVQSADAGYGDLGPDTGCVDRCALGQTRVMGGVKQTCQLTSEATGGVIKLDPTKLRDRARQFDGWIRQRHLPRGTISSTEYTDVTYTKKAAYPGTGDSAIWTGTYLAGEVYRYQVTGSPDARQNIEALVEAIHRLFEVTGHAGFMARFTAPVAGPDPLINKIYELQNPHHHKVTYNGQDYFWNGNTSRDQYQGVLLGYALAYEALPASATKHRQMIREDLVALCDELIKERKAVPITIRFYALGQWIELPLKIDLQYTVLNPSEYVKGTPYVQFGQTSDPSNYEKSSMAGFREFWPDYSKVLKQLPVLGPLIVFPVPRSGSAIMLASILRVGMLVTKGVPGYAAKYAAYKSHYDANVGSWLSIMKLYIFPNAAQCWKQYYGLNIVFQPAYNLVRLEDKATLKQSFWADVLESKMWPIVKDHKNVYFSYIYASQAPASVKNVWQVTAAAEKQLDLIPAAAFADLPFDLTGKYPADPSCPGLAKSALDANHRPGTHWIWGRHPFGLVNKGRPLRIFPRIDFTVPYWMGRHYGFLKDDAPGTCLRWLP